MVFAEDDVPDDDDVDQSHIGELSAIGEDSW